MLKIGINGFGRIGRAFCRINLKYKKYEIVAVNDIDPDINNLAYLLKYDTTYGKLHSEKVEVNNDKLAVNGSSMSVFCEKEIDKVPWSKLGVDIVIDSSGVLSNVIASSKVIDSGVKKVITTHSPKEGTDITVMIGVNENEYDRNRHHVISGSICDANAVAPFYKALEDSIGIEMGEVTTLHPWLSYQNLVDGTVKSVSSPGHYWGDYALGRSSVGSLIPKDTTLCNALEKVLPGVSNSVHSSSFRTPTAIVSAADGVFFFKRDTNIEEVLGILKDYIENNPGVLTVDDRSLISIDYLANENAGVIDKRWLHLNKNRMLKFVLWYDNEWGYTYRVYTLTDFLLNGK